MPGLTSSPQRTHSSGDHLWRGASALSVIVEEDALAAQRLLHCMETGQAESPTYAASNLQKDVCYCSDHPYHELKGRPHTHLPRVAQSGALPVLLYLCCALLALLVLHSLANSSPLPEGNAVSAEPPPSMFWAAVDAAHLWLADTLLWMWEACVVAGTWVARLSPF